jgi:N-acetylneuraminic acid mutarotase
LGLLVLPGCLCHSADAQTGQWTWTGGSSTVGSNGGQSGVYGVLGTPAAGNAPGGRYGAANWTGSDGHFWLFGGYGYDAAGNFGYLNDLWEFNPSTGEWAWMSGSDTVGGHGGQPGVYGTLGTPAAGNTPGSRNFAACWTDGAGNLWLFGGWDYDTDAIAGELDDLWEFNPSTSQWAWMGGSSKVGPHDGQSGVYGTLGTPAAGNTPGGLFAPSSWTDDSGNFWLFGGQGYDGNGNFHELNGLWEFNAAAAEWAWMGGSKTVGSEGDVPGVYGTLATPAAGNIPGNRSGASNWTAGSLWLFGGNGYDSAGNGGLLNDLWEFDPADGQWAWMSGSDTVGSNGAQSGVYGTFGTPAAGNAPGGREDATGWTDAKGNLWLLGGYGVDAGGNGGYLNDVWVFSPANGDWAWMGGSSTVGGNGGQSGVYGILGTPAAGNVPGSREAASGWTDGNGNLWLFGGYGYDSAGNLGYLNDLWKYPPSATSPPAAAAPTFSPAAGAYAAAQTVTLSDSTAGATIYYTTNGSAPTVSSAVYTSAITVASSETLQAIATAIGFSTSAVASASYTIAQPAAATPAFSLPAGTYASAQSVTISDSTAGATIYYTTNGTTPTISSAVYSGTITVSATETIEAMATASGYSPSAVETASYTINLPAAATPSFFPAAGTYSTAQNVTLSDSIAGATIYYTTNGSSPTISSTVYTSAITVASTETLQAIATASGLTTSAVATASYTISLPAGTFAIAGTAVSVAAGATNGNISTITITPSGGFTGAIGLSGAVTATPAGAQEVPTLSFGSTSPVQITGSGAATASLTVTTIAANSAMLAHPELPAAGRAIFGGAALACALLFFVPTRRNWPTLLGWAALFATLAGGAAACGTNVTRNVVNKNPGTTPGAYTITVTGTSGATAISGTFIVTVQ